MRVFIVFVLSCASVLGADTGVRIVTTAKTNAETASLYTRDVFTRDGQTNLVRTTKTKGGVVEARIQRFYHAGVLVGNYEAIRDSSGFSTEAGSPYAVTFEFWPSRDVRSAVIGTKDGVILDAFTATNGVFYPADSLLIRKANDVGGDVSRLLSPAHVTNTPTGEFRQEVERLIEKHKGK
jgi:hypothetical protein